MKNLFVALIAFLLLSCGSSSNQSQSESTNSEAQVDRRDQLRLNQYVVNGKELYTTYCSACHQANGEGLAAQFPPLAKSDYLLEDLARAACGIKNGQSGPITVNGVEYNMLMPGLPNLTNLEIAQIITYITNDWGNDAGLSDVNAVEEWLANCE